MTEWQSVQPTPFYCTQLWKLQEESTEPTEPVKNIYTIIFNEQKGNVTTAEAEEDSKVAFTHDSACDGFKFEGWFTKAKNGTKLNSFIAEKDMTVYAHWTELTKTEEVKKEEVKPASKSSDTSETTNVVLYAIGVIAAVGVTGMMIRNRMHKYKILLIE